MPVQLSDLLAPTTLPNTAGAAMPASAKGKEGAFAQELAATQVGTGGTSAGATTPAMAAATTISNTAQISPALREALEALRAAGGIKPEGIQRPTKLPPEIVAALPSDLEVDPAVLQRMKDGTATQEDAKAFFAALEKAGGLNVTAETGDADAEDASAVAATAVAPAQPSTPQTDVNLTDALADNEEIALKIADEKRPYIPPRPDIPDAPQQKPVQEGRAAATAPAPAVAPTSIETQDASSAVKTLLETIAPRAMANVAITADAAKPQTTQVGTQASTPVPPAAQAIANTPYVTSIQGTVTAATDASTDAPAVPQTAANTAAAPSTPTAPQTPVPATADPADAAPETALTPPPAEGEAVEAAMAVLTKDKADVKAAAQTAKPEIAAQKPDAGATEEGEVAAQKSAEATAKPQDVKPEPKPELQSKPADKPAVTEKPATPDAKVQQVQTPMTDKPILVDAAMRATQQQMQTLPATAIHHIASEMAARVNRGHTRFEIRLDPPELGRVDVRIEVDADGKVHSRLMVEKSETLDLLKADQRALERALHDAGFKSDQNSLSFSLKDGRGDQQKFAEQRFLREMHAPAEPAEEPARLVADIAYRAPMRGPGGIDMRI